MKRTAGREIHGRLCFSSDGIIDRLDEGDLIRDIIGITGDTCRVLWTRREKAFG
jgi:hypothetical protein